MAPSTIANPHFSTILGKAECKVGGTAENFLKLSVPYNVSSNSHACFVSASLSKTWKRTLTISRVQAEANETVEVGSELAAEIIGEVDRIVGSRVVDRRTQYLLSWKDGHPDSWVAAENVAGDIVGGYDEPWWAVAKKAETEKILELLGEGRDVDAIDGNERTALLYAAGMGSDKLVRLLVEAGADVQWQDKDGYSALHLAAGYVHTTIVKVLLELGADVDLLDSQGRTAMQLAQDLLQKLPSNNPLQFGRRIALDNIIKMLDEATFEEVEVEQVLDRRVVEGVTEYLVKWSDESENSWEPQENIAEDLLSDFLQGLEYGEAEKILDKRVFPDSKVEYLVKWEDTEEDTWEPEVNLAPELIAEYEGIEVEVVAKRLEALLADGAK